jgi:hypothetical protein
VSDVLAEIAAERRRQVEKGWTPDHDDQHGQAEIIRAEEWGVESRVDDALDALAERDILRYRHLLLTATALLVAEIERIDRQAARSAGEDGR